MPRVGTDGSWLINFHSGQGPTPQCEKFSQILKVLKLKELHKNLSVRDIEPKLGGLLLGNVGKILEKKFSGGGRPQGLHAHRNFFQDFDLKLLRRDVRCPNNDFLQKKICGFRGPQTPKIFI